MRTHFVDTSYIEKRIQRVLIRLEDNDDYGVLPPFGEVSQGGASVFCNKVIE